MESKNRVLALFIHSFLTLARLPSADSIGLSLYQKGAMLHDRIRPNRSLAGVSVILGTHGSGSSMLASALAEHPCFISIGEPFGDGQMIYAPDEVALSAGVTTLFRNNSVFDANGSYEKLKMKIAGFFEKKVGKGSSDWLDAPLLEVVPAGMGDFFTAIGQLACDHYPLVDACEGQCVFSHKLFPDYVSNVFDECDKYLLSATTSVIHLQRNEDDVAASNARRFGRYGQRMVDRDNAWNAYINELSHRTSATKVWQHFDFDSITEGSSAYFDAVKGFCADLGLDAEVLLKPVRELIDKMYAEYSNSSGHLAR